MAKKFVRGITDVKTINNQDFDTNNVNDLLSDGQYNYIHRKKGKTEEYHNLTDNIKTLSSDNTELLSVTNNNKTTNTATLHPKHDKQKEQLLESTRNTITIQHATNGTDEKTTVDTNPTKVLEHENLQTDYGISKNTTGNTTKLGLEYTRVPDGFDLNTLTNGNIRSSNLTNAPEQTGWFLVSAYSEGNYTYQRAIKLVDSKNTTYVRSSIAGSWGEWREQVGDKSVIDGLLAQKQNKLTASDGVTIDNNTIKLYTIDNYEGDLNEITFNALVKTAENATNVPQDTRPYGIVDVHRIRNHITQLYYDYHGKCYVRTANLHNPTETWKDWNTLQYELTSNASIGVNGNALQQLYSQNQTYTHDNGVLKTHVKSLALNTAVATAKEEFNFILKINKGQQSATFTLNETDKTHFGKIITAYGVDSTVRINGCLFTLSDATLAVSTDANTGSNLVITFSDILD